jgi:hypothetical protein
MINAQETFRPRVFRRILVLFMTPNDSCCFLETELQGQQQQTKILLWRLAKSLRHLCDKGDE